MVDWARKLKDLLYCRSKRNLTQGSLNVVCTHAYIHVQHPYTQTKANKQKVTKKGRKKVPESKE